MWMVCGISLGFLTGLFWTPTVLFLFIYMTSHLEA